MHHAFLYISLPSLHDYNVKVPIRSSGFELFLLRKPCLKLGQYVDYTVIKQLFDEGEYDMKNYADLGRVLSANV